MEKQYEEKEDLTTLGLSDKDFTKMEDWELYGFLSPEEYDDYVIIQSLYNDEEYDNFKSELLG